MNTSWSVVKGGAEYWLSVTWQEVRWGQEGGPRPSSSDAVSDVFEERLLGRLASEGGSFDAIGWSDATRKISLFRGSVGSPPSRDLLDF